MDVTKPLIYIDLPLNILHLFINRMPPKSRSYASFTNSSTATCGPKSAKNDYSTWPTQGDCTTAVVTSGCVTMPNKLPLSLEWLASVETRY